MSYMEYQQATNLEILLKVPEGPVYMLYVYMYTYMMYMFGVYMVQLYVAFLCYIGHHAPSRFVCYIGGT